MTCWGSIRRWRLEAMRSEWRRQVRETHPDRLMHRGLPEEALKLAEKRLIAVNRAWERILAERTT